MRSFPLLRVSLAWAIAAVAWVLFIQGPVTHLVEQAYRGESFALLNDRVSREDGVPKKSLESYFAKCRAVRNSGLAIIAIAGLLLVVRRSKNWRSLERTSLAWLFPAIKTTVEPPPKSLRGWVVRTTIAVAVIGHFVTMGTSSEIWPLSHYPMYAGTVSRDFTIDALYGVEANNHDTKAGSPAAELRLDTGDYIQAARLKRMMISLRRATREMSRAAKSRSKTTSPEAIDAQTAAYESARQDAETLCRWALDQYESKRIARKHSGPKIDGIRFYESTWDLDPAARLAEKEQHNGPTQLPAKERELLFELTIRQ